LIFSSSGWKRISAVGGTQKTLDLAMLLCSERPSDEGDHITLYGGEAANAFGDTWRLEDRS
jgi:hypothetical protein